MTHRPLDGKCALVTGSTGGIGRDIAKRLAAEGCHLVLSGFGSAGDIGALQNDIAAHGVRSIHVGADLRNSVEAVQLVDQAVREFGTVDILVNNAVVRHTAPVDGFGADEWDEAVAVNLSAAFHTIRTALPGMKRKEWGRIVNVSSIYGLRGAANRVAYVTTKTALIGLTRAVAMEALAHGITCNAICPGTTDTPLHQSTVETLMASRQTSRADAERIFFAGKQPTGRFVPSRSVAALVAFLCGLDAGDITGAALPIDGGWSAG